MQTIDDDKHHKQQTGKDVDHFSLHTGCPVLKGTKWSATKWIHNQPFRPNMFKKVDLGKCENRNEMCETWYVDWDRGLLLGTYPSIHSLRTRLNFEKSDNVPNRAKAGECTKNSAYMVGTLVEPGACRLACKACVKCAEGDVLCQRKNYKGNF